MEGTPEKSIDIMQLGRKNEVLHKFALKLTKKYPEIEYVYQIKLKNEYMSKVITYN